MSGDSSASATADVWEGTARCAYDQGTVGAAGETDFFRTLLGNVSEGILAVDASGRIVFVNAASATVFGYEPEDLVGESLTTLIPDRLADSHRAGFDRYLATGERTRDWDDVRLLGRRRGGGEVPISVSFREVECGDRRLFVGLVRDDSERRRRLTELNASKERYRRLLDTAPDAVFIADAETGEIVDANAAAADLVGASREELIGRRQTELHPSDEEERYAAVFDDHVERDGVVREDEDLYVVHADGHRIPVEVSAGVTEFDGATVVQAIFRDISERRRRERELALHREELARLNRVNRVIRRTNRALVDAETRSEIERTVCERLIDARPYVFAWMGSVNRPGERVVPEARAGAEDGYLDAISIPLSGDAMEGPTARAVRTREVEAIQDLETDETYAPWRDQALERGYRSSAAIPVVFEDRLFGVLCLYADTSDAFDTEERAVLAELGRTVGHAINALERKEALMSDSVIEVHFRSEAVARGLPAAVADAGTVTFDRIVHATDDRYLQYVTVTDVETDRFADVVLQCSTYEDARCVRENEDECVFELHARDPPVTSLVATYGGRVSDVAVARDELHVTVELPMQTDVRQFVNALRDRVPDAELVSQRTAPRRSHTPDGIRVSLEEELTERQRTTVETAYYAGYFNWPRDSTAEEVADRLDVSSPTVHKHLRAAEQKILRTILE